MLLITSLSRPNGNFSEYSILFCSEWFIGSFISTEEEHGSCFGEKRWKEIELNEFDIIKSGFNVL